MFLHDIDHDGNGEHLIFPKLIHIRGIPLGEAKINILLIQLYKDNGIDPFPESFKDLSSDYLISLDNMVRVTVNVFFATQEVAVKKNTKEFAHDTYDPHSSLKGLSPKEYELRYDPDHITVSHWRAMNKGLGSPFEECLMSLNFQRYQKETADVDKGSKKMRKILSQPDLLENGNLKDENLLKLFETMASFGIKKLFGLSLLNSRVFKWDLSWISKDIDEGSTILPENDIHGCLLEHTDK